MQPEIKQIIVLLEKKYGNRRLVPHFDPLGELVQTILSQNTSDANSRPAYKALKAAYGRWEDILTADIAKIADLIKSGGLGQIKARRIQEAFLEIERKRGALDLSFLSDMPLHDAGEWLKQLPGVGDKTANCVLLFALGKPALPVDTHIFRVAGRLGLIPGKSSLAEAHRRLAEIVPGENVYAFHTLMIEHGRRTCLARRPDCLHCILKTVCPSYRIWVGYPSRDQEG